MIKKIKQKRITLYAKSGRISIKRIISIVNDHIESNNKYFALKALNELKTVVKQQYNNYIDTINDMDERINAIPFNDTHGDILQCLNCDHVFSESKLVPGFYHCNDGYPMPTDVCPKCGSCAYETYEHEQGSNEQS